MWVYGFCVLGHGDGISRYTMKDMKGYYSRYIIIYMYRKKGDGERERDYCC